MSIYLGPSAASRWLKCTASPGYLVREAHRIVREQRDYTDEGIEAHDWAARAFAELGLFDYDVIPDPAMRGHVKDYVEFVLAKVKPGDLLIVEQKVPLFYMPARNGMVDAAIVSDGKIDINDLKYGQGVSVEAIKNPQLAIYGKSIIEDLIKKGHSFPSDTSVTLTIYQPRARDSRVERVWSVTLAELYEFCEHIANTANEILLDPDGGVFYPDDEGPCRFCDAKGFCVARAQKLLGELPDDVATVKAIVPKPPADASLTFPAPQSLTHEQIAKIIKVKSDFVGWLEDIASYGRSLMETDTPLPGFKLVEGKSNRRWRNEEDAAKVLGYRLSKDEMYSRELISPAQAEKLLKDRNLTTRLKNKLEACIEKPPGKPTMVPESDPRDPISKSLTSQFDNLNESDNNLL